jgi:hypothetical protein
MTLRQSGTVAARYTYRVAAARDKVITDDFRR